MHKRNSSMIENLPKTHQQLVFAILKTLNKSTEKASAIREILMLLQAFTGFEAIGIRLKDGLDYPYYETSGFPFSFVKAENSLCIQDPYGEILCDSTGNAVLECMCGNIIRGRTNPSTPFFTEGGSFFTNSTTQLLASTTEEDRKARTRNRCNGEGYESVALIPLYSDEEIVGVLQLNDRRKNLFSSEVIGFLEGIGESVGVALARIQSETLYHVLTENVADGVCIIQDKVFTFMNTSLAEMFGYTRDYLIKKNPVDLFHNDYKKQFENLISSPDEILRVDHFQALGICKNGDTLWIEERHSIIDWQGKVAVLITMRNITEGKLREISILEENIRLKKNMRNRYKLGPVIGKSQVMQEVYELMLKASESDETVLIMGESGTGKEMIARTIHHFGKSITGTFIPVNCGALPETLFESELFGYKKGAFTGAQASKHGFFDLANGGTLFLDEVGELALRMQVKLLRAIEGSGYTPLGGEHVIKPNVRIIAATNKNLNDMVTKGLFREDFFYRLHIILITIPPLRVRKEDLPLLIDHFLKMYSGRADSKISGRALERLYQYDWPGNVRELENVIRRYAAINQIQFASPHHVDFQVLKNMDQRQSHHGKTFCIEKPDLREAMAFFEKNFIQQALEQNKWHRGKTAKALNIPERTLYRKMKQFQLNMS